MRRRVMAILALTFLPLTWMANANANPCAMESIGIDTSVTNGSESVWLGQAAGQTFFAAETLVSSITAWRWAPWDTNLAVWHMRIYGLDEFGTPDVHQLIHDGPLVQVPYSDGVHAVPFRFVFDPPVNLPGPGEYEFAIQGDDCQGLFDLAANWSDAYSGGRYWLHDRVLSDCHVRARPGGDPSHDLIFQIEFCEPAVPTQAPTWGRFKAGYR